MMSQSLDETWNGGKSVVGLLDSYTVPITPSALISIPALFLFLRAREKNSVISYRAKEISVLST